MKILSLFDGISCARVALERAGIPIEAYYASEVDKYAIQISKKNYPDIRHIGDVKTNYGTLNGFYYPTEGGHFIETKIDLLIGGSPCQDLSIAKKNRKGLDGERSGLFWEYVRILKEVKPKYFILENVASMPKEAKAVITEALGVEPIMINASLVSAQNRKRLFWVGKRIDIYNSDNTYSATEYQKVDVTQPTIQKDGQSFNQCEGQVIRKLTCVECERLQGLPDYYTEGVSNTQRYKALGNAFNVDVVAHILSFIK